MSGCMHAHAIMSKAANACRQFAISFIYDVIKAWRNPLNSIRASLLQYTLDACRENITFSVEF
jgi:hypothetical protein